jgi:hypothetical protein
MVISNWFPKSAIVDLTTTKLQLSVSRWPYVCFTISLEMWTILNERKCDVYEKKILSSIVDS